MTKTVAARDLQVGDIVRLFEGYGDATVVSINLDTDIMMLRRPFVYIDPPFQTDVENFSQYYKQSTKTYELVMRRSA